MAYLAYLTLSGVSANIDPGARGGVRRAACGVVVVVIVVVVVVVVVV